MPGNSRRPGKAGSAGPCPEIGRIHRREIHRAGLQPFPPAAQVAGLYPNAAGQTAAFHRTPGHLRRFRLDFQRLHPYIRILPAPQKREDTAARSQIHRPPLRPAECSGVVFFFRRPAGQRAGKAGEQQRVRAEAAVAGKLHAIPPPSGSQQPPGKTAGRPTPVFSTRSLPSGQNSGHKKTLPDGPKVAGNG